MLVWIHYVDVSGLLPIRVIIIRKVPPPGFPKRNRGKASTILFL